jgi:hypothetical protein
MGHQLARATVAATLTLSLLGAGCEGGDEAPPDALETARSLAEQAAGDPSVVPTGTSSLGLDVAELPAPDRSTFGGETRVVNLWVGAAGEHQVVDVWGRRTFTNGPVLLIEGLAFAEVSAPFGVPQGYSVVVVGVGAGPDGLELGGVSVAGEGERVLTVFTNADETGRTEAYAVFEVDRAGAFGAPAPPTDGSGLLVLRQANTDAFRGSLQAVGGSDSFYVGDGAGSCLPQRGESTGTAASVLGGTQPVELEVAGGSVNVSLHDWTDPDRCASASLAEFDVEVAPGDAVLGLVYTPDGQSLALMTVPMQLS